MRFDRFDGVVLQHSSERLEKLSAPDLRLPPYGPSGFVVLVDLRPSDQSKEPTIPTGLWDEVKNPKIRKIFPTIKSKNPSIWRDDVLDLAKSGNHSLIALVIIASCDSEEDRVLDWARWGRTQSISFIAAVNPPLSARDIFAAHPLFDFIYEAEDPSGLLYVPRSIVESSESIISYDFSDLENAWRGHLGTVWQMPSDKLTFERFLLEWQNSNCDREPAAWTLSCFGLSMLSEIDVLLSCAERAFKTCNKLIAAWCSDDVDNTPHQLFCILSDKPHVKRD